MQERIVELLTRKIAGEATEDELIELYSLISRHPDSVYYEEFLNQLWMPVPGEAATDHLYDLHKAKYQSELDFSESEERPLFSKYRNLLVAVCSILLVAATGFWFYMNSHSDTRYTLDTHIVSGKSVRKKIKLPDGTMVWLNADSKLSYDKEMKDKAERSVDLIGEAFFDVAHDKKHPFIVHTDKIAIKVLGTAFNVKAYPSDEKYVTSLLRGSIELTINDRPQQKILLKPSEKFAFIDNKNTITDKAKTSKINRDITLVIENIAPVKIRDVEYIEETSWTENKLVFQNESFEELVPKLERWFNVKFQIDGDAVKSYRFTGVFTHENIEQALTAMKLIKPFNFKLKDHDVKIY